MSKRNTDPRLSSPWGTPWTPLAALTQRVETKTINWVFWRAVHAVSHCGSFAPLLLCPSPPPTTDSCDEVECFPNEIGPESHVPTVRYFGRCHRSKGRPGRQPCRRVTARACSRTNCCATQPRRPYQPHVMPDHALSQQYCRRALETDHLVGLSLLAGQMAFEHQVIRFSLPDTKTSHLDCWLKRVRGLGAQGRTTQIMAVAATYVGGPITPAYHEYVPGSHLPTHVWASSEISFMASDTQVVIPPRHAASWPGSGLTHFSLANALAAGFSANPGIGGPSDAACARRAIFLATGVICSLPDEGAYLPEILTAIAEEVPLDGLLVAASSPTETIEFMLNTWDGSTINVCVYQGVAGATQFATRLALQHGPTILALMRPDDAHCVYRPMRSLRYHAPTHWHCPGFDVPLQAPPVEIQPVGQLIGACCAITSLDEHTALVYHTFANSMDPTHGCSDGQRGAVKEGDELCFERLVFHLRRLAPQLLASMPQLQHYGITDPDKRQGGVRRQPKVPPTTMAVQTALLSPLVEQLIAEPVFDPSLAYLELGAAGITRCVPAHLAIDGRTPNCELLADTFVIALFVTPTNTSHIALWWPRARVPSFRLPPSVELIHRRLVGEYHYDSTDPAELKDTATTGCYVRTLEAIRNLAARAPNARPPRLHSQDVEPLVEQLTMAIRAATTAAEPYHGDVLTFFEELLPYAADLTWTPGAVDSMVSELNGDMHFQMCVVNLEYNTLGNAAHLTASVRHTDMQAVVLPTDWPPETTDVGRAAIDDLVLQEVMAAVVTPGRNSRAAGYPMPDVVVVVVSGLDSTVAAHNYSHVGAYTQPRGRPRAYGVPERVCLAGHRQDFLRGAAIARGHRNARDTVAAAVSTVAAGRVAEMFQGAEAIATAFEEYEPGLHIRYSERLWTEEANTRRQIASVLATAFTNARPTLMPAPWAQLAFHPVVSRQVVAYSWISPVPPFGVPSCGRCGRCFAHQSCNAAVFWRIQVHCDAGAHAADLALAPFLQAGGHACDCGVDDPAMCVHEAAFFRTTPFLHSTRPDRVFVFARPAQLAITLWCNRAAVPPLEAELAYWKAAEFDAAGTPAATKTHVLVPNHHLPLALFDSAWDSQAVSLNADRLWSEPHATRPLVPLTRDPSGGHIIFSNQRHYTARPDQFANLQSAKMWLDTWLQRLKHVLVEPGEMRCSFSSRHVLGGAFHLLTLTTARVNQNTSYALPGCDAAAPGRVISGGRLTYDLPQPDGTSTPVTISAPPALVALASTHALTLPALTAQGHAAISQSLLSVLRDANSQSRHPSVMALMRQLNGDVSAHADMFPWMAATAALIGMETAARVHDAVLGVTATSPSLNVLMARWGQTSTQQPQPRCRKAVRVGEQRLYRQAPGHTVGPGQAFNPPPAPSPTPGAPPPPPTPLVSCSVDTSDESIAIELFASVNGAATASTGSPSPLDPTPAPKKVSVKLKPGETTAAAPPAHLNAVPVVGTPAADSTIKVDIFEPTKLQQGKGKGAVADLKGKGPLQVKPAASTSLPSHTPHEEMAAPSIDQDVLDLVAIKGPVAKQLCGACQACELSPEHTLSRCSHIDFKHGCPTCGSATHEGKCVGTYCTKCRRRQQLHGQWPRLGLCRHIYGQPGSKERAAWMTRLSLGPLAVDPTLVQTSSTASAGPSASDVPKATPVQPVRPAPRKPKPRGQVKRSVRDRLRTKGFPFGQATELPSARDKRCAVCLAFRPKKFRWPSGICPACHKLGTAAMTAKEADLWLAFYSQHRAGYVPAPGQSGPVLLHSPEVRPVSLTPIQWKVKPVNTNVRLGYKLYTDLELRQRLPAQLLGVGLYVLPSLMATTRANTFCAIRCRMAGLPKHAPLANAWPCAHALLFVRRVLGNSRQKPERLRVLSFEDWVAAFPPQRRMELRRAWADWQRGATSWREAGRFSFLVKRELAGDNTVPYYMTADAGEGPRHASCSPASEPQDPVATGHFRLDAAGARLVAPRGLCAPHDAAHCIVGPTTRPALHALADIFSHDNPIFYCCGVVPRLLDRRLDQIASLSGWLYFEVDYSSYDQSIRSEALNTAMLFLADLGVDVRNSHLAEIMRRWAKPAGRSRCGLTFKGDYMNASGRDDTAFINGVCNISALGVSLLRIVTGDGQTPNTFAGLLAMDDAALLAARECMHAMILGDDSFGAVPDRFATALTCLPALLAEFGFEAKFKVHKDVRQATFLGCRPWRTSHGWKWGRTPGRCVYKAHWAARPPKAAAAHLRGVSMGLQQAYPHVPVIKEFAAVGLRLTSGVVAAGLQDVGWSKWSQDYMRAVERRPQAERHTCTNETFEDLEFVYGITCEEYEDFCQAMQAVHHVPCLLDHSVLRKIIAVDGL